MIVVRKLLFLSVAIVIALAGKTFSDAAEKEHDHKTPHGGVIQDADGMHAEFLLDKNGEPKVFLYDKGMKPLERSDLQARLTLKAHDGNQYTRDLKFSKDPKDGALLEGEPIKGLTDWDTVVVSVKVKDTWTHLRFSHHH